MNQKCTLLLLTFLLFSTGNSFAIIVNGYAKVTSIASTDLSVSNVNQTNHSFVVGEYVVLMQMQDDVIGANTADASTFGDLSSIGNAGRYEIKQITGINGTTTAGFSSATPTTITIQSITHTYNTGTNSSVQLITFRRMSATDYSTTAAITALSWDGNVGGVVAMEVPGILTLNHSITANAQGFRGGAVSANFYIGGTACYTTPYRSSSTNYGYKGEGIYKSTAANYTNGRGKILNGAGGGVEINAGGGGGGNYTSGGIGGSGWNGGTGCSVATGGHGLGGIALSAHISSARIFMGGGGGGGQQNNGQSTAGGAGGGIVMIKAGTLRTTGTCGGYTISANGATASNSGGDGGGGGGAGGSVLFWVNTWSISGSCVLTIQANGGNGATVNSSTHGGGGAGGQGVVIYNSAQPTTNITTQTNNGTAGCNNNSVPCTSSAGSASGSNNNGISSLQSSGNPLPIELISFSARPQDQMVRVQWTTASEQNCSHFTLLKSTNGIDWIELDTKAGAGNSNDEITYFSLDEQPEKGINYYRLIQHDFNGDKWFSEIIAIDFNGTTQNWTCFPNPASAQVYIQSNTEDDVQNFSVFDVSGKTMEAEYYTNSSGQIILNTSEFSEGIYFVQVNSTYLKLIVRK
jgi:hypothetical protein